MWGEMDRWVVLIHVSELSGMEDAHGSRLNRERDQTAAWPLAAACASLSAILVVPSP